MVDGVGDAVAGEGLADDGGDGRAEVERSEAGDEDDGGGGRAGLDLVGQGGAVHFGHGAIGEDEVDGGGGEALEGFAAVGGGGDLVAVGAEEFAEDLYDGRLVIHDEDAEAAGEVRGSHACGDPALAAGEDEACRAKDDRAGEGERMCNRVTIFCKVYNNENGGGGSGAG